MSVLPYIEGFESLKEVADTFSIANDAHVRIAIYDSFGYEGSAFVAYFQGGKLFEINDSHCSCNGLGDDVTAEETTFAALRARAMFSYDSMTGPHREVLLDAMEEEAGTFGYIEDQKAKP